MRLFDLSHPIHNKIPLYPGTPQPDFKKLANIENNGYRESKLSFTSHIGTHIDAPSHMLEKGKFLDQYPISKFTGNAVIITVPTGKKIIDKQFLIPFEPDIGSTEFVLFNTGWYRFWENERYFQDFPVLDLKALKFLTTFNLKGIGFDTPSVDSIDSTTWENHIHLFKKNMIIIENLNFPGDLYNIKGEFSCFPINYCKADGSPVRAILKTGSKSK